MVIQPALWATDGCHTVDTHLLNGQVSFAASRSGEEDHVPMTA